MVITLCEHRATLLKTGVCPHPVIVSGDDPFCPICTLFAPGSPLLPNQLVRTGPVVAPPSRRTQKSLSTVFTALHLTYVRLPGPHWAILSISGYATINWRWHTSRLSFILLMKLYMLSIWRCVADRNRLVSFKTWFEKHGPTTPRQGVKSTQQRRNPPTAARTRSRACSAWIGPWSTSSVSVSLTSVYE